MSLLAWRVMASCGRSWYVSLLAASVFVAGAVFFVIGVLGPRHTWAHHHPVKTCVVENSYRHVFDPRSSLVDKTECEEVGKLIDLETAENKQLYPLANILFHVQIPFLKEQVMSRKFHFVVADLAVYFDNDFLKIIMEHDMNVLFLYVVLGYRDDIDGEWQRLVQGNVTRTLKCHLTEYNYLQCDHMQLFELGSVHHKQYIVNFAVPNLPLSSITHYSGIAPLLKISLYVIHQTIAFTELWFTLKCILFPISLVTTCWLLWRLAGKHSPVSLTHKCLLFLSITLTTYNAPVEMLSLYFNLPWMLVVDDFRQGLLISALFFFWIVFIGEHTAGDDVMGTGGSLGQYWKQLLTVATSAVFMFVYEFCERGVQTMYPFYSLWGSWVGETVAYVFVGVAMLAAVVYLVMFAVLVVRAYSHLRSRQQNIAHLSPQLQERTRAVFSQWKCFLLLTACVAVTSVSTVVLPSEALVHHWQHRRSEYSIYTALVIGNYGLWNAYALVTALLHAPVQADDDCGPSHSTETAEKLLTKSSVE